MSEAGALFFEFFKDLDFVPTDIFAGLILMRQERRCVESLETEEVSGINIEKKTLLHFFSVNIFYWEYIVNKRNSRECRSFSSLHLAVYIYDTLTIYISSHLRQGV